jgi:hypothetical protein
MENRVPHLIEIEDSYTPSPLAPAQGRSLVEGDSLRWSPVPGAISYNVCLGPANAEELSLLQTTTAAEARPSGLAPGRSYRWRADAILAEKTVGGAESTFVSRTAALADLPFTIGVLPALADQSFRFSVRTAAPEVAWHIVSDQPWLSLSATTGRGSASIKLVIDASSLENAANRVAHLSLVTADGTEDHVAAHPRHHARAGFESRRRRPEPARRAGSRLTDALARGRGGRSGNLHYFLGWIGRLCPRPYRQ